METHAVERKLAAILSADVKGYSRLMGDDEVATIRTLTAYREVMTVLILQYRGRVVDSPGDNLLAEFASVVDAVRCAVEIQRELKKHNADLPETRRMEFRIGINLGDVIVEGERIYGDGVNIAARLESLADAGGICISGGVYEQVENKLVPLSIDYRYLGEQQVKNITRPVPVYRVLLAAEEVSPDIPRGERFASLQPLPLPDKPSIAVLPFVNLSRDPEQEYFSDGITEDVITDLSKLSGLFVISRNSVFLYKGKTITPEQVSKELGVKYMLEGSVRKAANRVRVTAQLIDTATGYHLWADRYDRELQDIFAVQDDVTQQIVTALKVKLTEGEQKRMGYIPTTNLEAYEYFLRGLELAAHRSQAATAQARQMFERAIEIDRNFAAAYARLGRTYVLEWIYRWSDDPHLLEKALHLAQRAVALDASLPGPHQTLAYVAMARRQGRAAVVEAEQAVTLDPNDADAALTLSETLSCVGRGQEALRAVEQAMRLNPHYPASYVFAVAQAQYMTGQREQALETLHRVLMRNPDHIAAHFFSATINSELGRLEDARKHLLTCQRLAPRESPEQVLERIPISDQATLDRWVQALRRVWPQS